MPLFRQSEIQNRPKKLIIQPSATSPFCTNPSQLQEVTLDPDATGFLYMGMRSPGALTGGRSVKEIDEQLTNLKKENFDLKLRIYFLEERIGANFDTDKEDAIKQNIELRVELETVRKDLEEKQELLCQAAKAMEIEEEEKKKEIELRDEKIVKLESELLTTKNHLLDEINVREENKELALCAQAFDLNVEGDSGDNSYSKIKDLQIKLEKEQERGDQYEDMIDNIKVRCKELEDEIELKNNRLNGVTSELEEAAVKLSTCNLRILELEEGMSRQCSNMQLAMEQLQQRDYDIKQRKTEFKELKKRCDILVQEKIKFEKMAGRIHNDYLTLLTQFRDAQTTIENLRTKIQTLETPGTGSSLQQVATQNTGQETIHVSISKTTPKVNVINASHTDASTSPASLRKLQSCNEPNGVGEVVPYNNISESNSVTDTSLEVCTSQEKHLELQKDHFKACKMIKSLIQKKKECDQNIHELHVQVADQEKTIGYLQKRISELTYDTTQRKKPIQEMVTEMKLTACFDPAATKENAMDIEDLNLAETYKELVVELETKIEVLKATLSEKDFQLEQLKIDLQEKANRIIDLEFELLAVSEGVSYNLNSSNEKEDTGTEKTNNDCDKDQLIERLENELRQRTSDLQGIVNKELWEKNRSIEKMQNILKSKDVEINALEKNVQTKDLQFKILKDKISELGVHVNILPSLYTVQPVSQVNTPDSLVAVQDQLKICLEERKHFIKEIEELQKKINNIPEHDENLQLKQLTTEYEDLREELEKTEKLRQESHEICLILTARLEELCCFLNSLLKQKSILGFLGNDKTAKLQEAINRSLDLSQTLSTGLLLNPDQSLLQLHNITNLLNSSCNDSDIFGKLLVQDDDNSAILSIIPSDVKLTYRSHLNIPVGGNNEQEQVINILRQQISNLKHEIELRDVELGKKLNEQGDVTLNKEADIQIPTISKVNLSYTVIKKQRDSDSESWSEPDRSVSLARIGLLDGSLKAPSNASTGRHGRFAAATGISTESTENENVLHGTSIKTPSKRTTLAESRQTVISLHEQVCELEEKLREKENHLLTAQVAVCETENLLKKEQLKSAEMRKEIVDSLAEVSKRLEESECNRKLLEQRTAEANTELVFLNERINEKNKILEETEKNRATYEAKILELQTLVGVVEAFKKNTTSLNAMNKELQNTINQLEIEKEKAIDSAQTTKIMLEKANKDVETAHVELKNMQKREQQIRDELEQNFQNNLKNAEEQYINSVRSIERNYEAQTNKCQETVIRMKEEYERDYIKRSEVDKRMLELDGITKEVESLKYFVKDCETKMRIMEEREMELKTKVQDMQREHHDKIYQLHSELDNATLQYSETLLEKTRLQNENTCLEQKIQNFHMKETDLINEVTNLHKEFKDVQNHLHMQIAQLEYQKSLLDLKVCDLEAANAELQAVGAELRNRMIKLQMNKKIGERILSTSLPTCSGAILDLYPNKTLPINIAFHSNQVLSDNSGYTSEDVMGDEMRKHSDMLGNKVLTEIDQERLGNSSPDLGIESDHGRFSSMECNANISRPLLPTLELTQSMNSLLDPIQDITCANDQCCMKTKRISDENTELRKRLLRTRRALEDTLHRLTLANKQKKEVEKSICKQIHQTSQVLRKAKANLDSGSESDARKN